MKELENFYNKLCEITDCNTELTIDSARKIVQQINEFLFTNYEGIGNTQALGETFQYLSEFHKFWETYHKEILDIKIDEIQCEKVVDALIPIYDLTEGSAFKEVYDTGNLTPEEICKIRFLTANQEFRTSIGFSDFAKLYDSDNGVFDIQVINANPQAFLASLGLSGLSQSDKRILYAKSITDFLIEKQCEPYELLSYYQNDLYRLREDLISYQGSGFGNKKTDMFIRDMVVLGVWKDVKNFDKIDVASDVNTNKVALRSGIIKSAIPLVSSFIDIFCHQYSYVDQMNALAWRKVWEIWQKKYPDRELLSPCLLDYFVYNVIGKQFCKESLSIFKCDTEEHVFRWHSGNNKRCQICYSKKIKDRSATRIALVKPCTDVEGFVKILKTPFVTELPEDKKITECPLKKVCSEYGKQNLMPPKSISIKGRTGWTEAYSDKDNGGGGLMA